MKLWQKILIGMFLGTITGLVFQDQVLWLKVFGDAFLQLINMIIPLLVFASMTVGVTNIHDPKKMGRVGIMTLTLYLITTVFAILIGLLITTWIQPGAGLNMDVATVATPVAPLTLGQLISSILPKNPVLSLAEGHVLQIIIFSVIFGFGISFSGERGKPLLRVMESLADVMIKVTGMVIELTPYAVFALMAWVFGTFGIKAILPLLKLLGGLYLGYAVHIAVVFCFILKQMAKMPIVPFFRGMSDAIVMAFTTCSSSATLPVSMSCVQDKLGVSKSISGFMLPLGATINMNGTALYQASAALFIAQAYGITLDFNQIITIVMTATLAAIGTAGIPGSGFIMLTAVISAAGLPIEGVAILAGIDRLREMGGTTLNVLGDAVCSIYVAKKEKELDPAVYLAQ